MIANRIKALWSEDRPVVNGWLSIANTLTTETLAEQGYDALTIDMQHGIIDYQDAVAMMQAMRASAVTPVVRVPWLDPSWIMKSLDAGAFGVICPLINTREQAEELVSYVRYPPVGQRSFGPTRAMYSAGANYGSEADDNIICLAMIETREGFDNVEAIAATPGLDGIYIGPGDLTLGLTGRAHPIGVDREEPVMIDAIKHILAAAHGAGIRAGLHCLAPSYAARGVDWGFDLVTVSTDLRMLLAGAAATVRETRALLEGKTLSPSAKT